MNRDKRRADRYVNFAPKGPVYVNWMEKPIVPEFELERRRNSFAGKLSAFLAALSPWGTTPEEGFSKPVTEADIALLRSLEEDGAVYLPEEPDIIISETNDTGRTVMTKEEAGEIKQMPSILDIKDSVEAEARNKLREQNRAQMKADIKEYLSRLSDEGPFSFISIDELDELSDSELKELLNEAELEVGAQKVYTIGFSKNRWMEAEEYLLFSNKIDVKNFLYMLDSSGREILNRTETLGLFDWANDKNAEKAHYRYNNDIVHNWNVTNLKYAFTEAYKNSCEDGGKLDHDPILTFPNGKETRLSSFIGKDVFLEIAEAGAIGKDLVVPEDLDVGALKSA